MKKNDFEYIYYAPSATERKEIESIRNSYLMTSAYNKLNELRKLDSKVRNIPTAISLSVGILGLLIFGLGMAMILEWNIFAGGIAISITGLVLLLSAYPFHHKISLYMKNKYSQKIIKLSDELLNEKDK